MVKNKTREHIFLTNTDLTDYTDLFQRTKLALFDDAVLELIEHRAANRLDAVALEIVEQSHTEHSLIRTLDDAQDRLERLLLLGLEVVEEVALNRWWIDEVRLAESRRIARLAECWAIVRWPKGS